MAKSAKAAGAAKTRLSTTKSTGKVTQSIKASVLLDAQRNAGEVDDRLYSSFIEHLGRAVYTGIYEPGHKTADKEGFRGDVLALVKELNVPLVRYPGGNFVSNYRWEDGIGPQKGRPVRLDLAWRTAEPNTVGVGEFSRWAKKAGTEPMMAVNLGTRGIEQAMDLLEYCNHPGGSYLSDLRRSHGFKDPFGIKVWCLGNEMDGPWQVGHKTAAEYGRLAHEVGKAMKLFDPSLELVSCGSSNTGMPTFPEWERQTLEEAYDAVDYVSLHQYFGKRGGTDDFLACTLELDRFIRVIASVCDAVKAKRRGKKDIQISFDEWNVWYHSNQESDTAMRDKPWQYAPRLIEDIYTMEDALVVGRILITLLSHADRVKIACLAQLVNVIAPIMTEPGGAAWRQTIFYPFLHASKFGRGTAVLPIVQCDRHDTENFTDVPALEAVAVHNEMAKELALFLVNRDTGRALDAHLDLGDFARYAPFEHIALAHNNLLAANTLRAPITVLPTTKKLTAAALPSNGARSFTVRLAPASWNVLRLKR